MAKGWPRHHHRPPASPRRCRSWSLGDGRGYYAHAATRPVARLREFGYRIVEPSPACSLRACRLGRLAGLHRIVDANSSGAQRRARRRGSRRPCRLAPTWPISMSVVTAGGTAEPIDPVRFRRNRSTGKMGPRGRQKRPSIGRGGDADHGTRLRGAAGPAQRRPSRRLPPRCRRPCGPHPRRAPLRMSWSWPRPWPIFRPPLAVPTKLGGRTGADPSRWTPTARPLAETSETRPSQPSGRSRRTDPRRLRRGDTGTFRAGASQARKQGGRPGWSPTTGDGKSGSGFGTDTDRVTIFSTDMRSKSCRCCPKYEGARSCFSTCPHPPRERGGEEATVRPSPA